MKIKNITIEPLRLKYTNGRGRTATQRGSYITKCIKNQEKRKQEIDEKNEARADLIRKYENPKLE